MYAYTTHTRQTEICFYKKMRIGALRCSSSLLAGVAGLHELSNRCLGLLQLILVFLRRLLMQAYANFAGRDVTRCLFPRFPPEFWQNFSRIQNFSRKQKQAPVPGRPLLFSPSYSPSPPLTHIAACMTHGIPFRVFVLSAAKKKRNTAMFSTDDRDLDRTVTL
jgi:hypothetical protein